MIHDIALGVLFLISLFFVTLVVFITTYVLHVAQEVTPVKRLREKPRNSLARVPLH